jgi:hypothetical protein
MCSEEPAIDTLGITEACLEVMDSEKGTLATMEVVAELELRGFDVLTQKNAAASVHAILSRLAKKGRIVKVEPPTALEGKSVVLWRGPNFDPKYDGIPF